MTQASLWHTDDLSPDYAELCNALYERELSQLSQAELKTVDALQSRLKSLPYYIKRTAYAMTQVKTPLILDVHNASWHAKQNAKMPLQEQKVAQVWSWYQKSNLSLGLVIAIKLDERIVLDSIDRIDKFQQRFRCNAFGWFDQNTIEKVLTKANKFEASHNIQLLKPNKKVMMAACAGHRWKNNSKVRPQPLTLRELLLSCSINWTNFKKLKPSP